ncbi:MAG: hypothetical protein LBL80_05265 [Ruminococcus sp.]|nr:hypothetical protein [Ruminococcus sp.]
MINISGLLNLPQTDTITVSASAPICDCCGSKIYPGDTVYIVDRAKYCEDCVEVSELEDNIFTNLY